MATTLRDYQCGARDAALETIIGQIILPTGTGKSKIQQSIIESLILKNEGFGVYVILTPRILLTNQLMKSVASDLLINGVDNLKGLTVHSGSGAELYDEDGATDEEKAMFDGLGNMATVSSDTVAYEIAMAQAMGRPLLICCTYQSIPVMVRGVESAGVTIKQVLCDEAHYITEKENNENISKVKNNADRIHYFTATRKITASSNGLGMNNEDVFGSVIYCKTPREMIKAGYMVQPRIHSVLADMNTSMSRIVRDAYVEHSKHVRGSAKMLVCCNGTKTVEEIRNDTAFKEWADSEGVAVFSVTSKFGSFVYSNGVDTEYGRDTFLQKLKEFTGKAIVLHVAILTEGIDVPDMSGVVFVRNMGMCRFLQSLGRATRPLYTDFGLSLKNRTKKYAYAIVIDRVGADAGQDESDQYENLCAMVREMREAGFEAVEPIMSESDIGTDVEVVLDDTNKRIRRVKAFNRADNEVLQELEDERIAEIIADKKLSVAQQAKLAFDQLFEIN